MPHPQSRLDQISTLAKGMKDYRAQLKIEADAWINKQMSEKASELEQSVMAALEEGFRVMDIAAAYTGPGRTPNRNAIYAIKRRRTRPTAMWSGAYPFEWVDREVSTVSGTRTVWDVKATLSEFGPDLVSGVYRWTWVDGELEPVPDPDAEPYPYSKYYQGVLRNWLESNPYPGEE